MSDLSHLQAVKQRAADIAERFGDIYPRQLVDEYVQFSLGVAGMTGVESDTHPIDAMRTSALIAASNAGQYDEVGGLADKLLGDEALSRTIVEAHMEIN